MKNSYILLLFLVFPLTFINAQSKVFKVDPLGLVFDFASASYERKIENQQSITFSGLYARERIEDGIKIKGTGADVRWNFYFSDSTHISFLKDFFKK